MFHRRCQDSARLSDHPGRSCRSRPNRGDGHCHRKRHAQRTGSLIRGNSVAYDSRSEVAEIRDATYVLHARQMAGAADQLTRFADGKIEIEDGRMSYCPPDDPEWVMHAETLVIDPSTGDGQAWGAKLKVAGVPIMYLPWIRFPVDSRRKTGLLFPDIGSDTRGGIDITTPIYLNLAPNYDAAL